MLNHIVLQAHEGSFNIAANIAYFDAARCNSLEQIGQKAFRAFAFSMQLLAKQTALVLEI